MKNFLERYGIEIAAFFLIGSLGVHSLATAYSRSAKPATVRILGKDGRESSIQAYKDTDGTVTILESEFNAPPRK